MKILIVNNNYKPYFLGGAERVAENLMLGAKAAGHECRVAALRPRGEKQAGEDDSAVYFDSFFPCLLKLPKFLRIFAHIYNMVNGAGKLREYILKQKIDLVITNNLLGIGCRLPLFLRGAGIKHIHILHDIQLLHPSGLVYYGHESALETPWARAYQAVNRYFFQYLENVISPSLWLWSEHKRRGFFPRARKRIKANPLRVDRARKDGPRGDNFLYVGQIEEHKGVKLLVKAFFELAREHSGDAPGLDIIGSGRDLGSIKRYLGPNIRYLGRKDKHEVEAAMAGAGCLVVPSLCYENAPTVIFEAQSLGLPVIASDIGGIPELLTPESLFEPGDIEGLKSLILRARFSKNRPQAAGLASDPEEYFLSLAGSIEDIF